MIIAQQFTAGRKSERIESAKRTAETVAAGYLLVSVVRFTDFD